MDRMSRRWIGEEGRELVSHCTTSSAPEQLLKGKTREEEGDAITSILYEINVMRSLDGL